MVTPYITVIKMNKKMNCLYQLSFLFKNINAMHSIYGNFCYFELLKQYRKT